MMFSQLGWQLALESSLIAYSLPLTQVARRLHTALPALLWVPRPAMDIDEYRWMRLFKCVTLQSATPATFPVESSPRDGILKIKDSIRSALQQNVIWLTVVGSLPSSSP